jgi:hypothetical protein
MTSIGSGTNISFSPAVQAVARPSAATATTAVCFEHVNAVKAPCTETTHRAKELLREQLRKSVPIVATKLKVSVPIAPGLNLAGAVIRDLDQRYYLSGEIGAGASLFSLPLSVEVAIAEPGKIPGKSTLQMKLQGFGCNLHVCALFGISHSLPGGDQQLFATADVSFGGSLSYTLKVS